MPNNPHNTISTSALKIMDGSIKVAHECGTDILLKHKNRTSHCFRSNIDMEWKNGMDYLPIYVTLLPSHTKIISQLEHNNISSALTRSNTQEKIRSSRLNQ